MLDYEANMDMSEAMAQMTAEFCAAVSVKILEVSGRGHAGYGLPRG
jgi:roadblock/LC7 domain-containing protein